MPLPVPVPQAVLNQGASVIVAWRPLEGLDALATVLDGSGHAVASKTSAGGAPTCEVPAPASWSEPPYTVTVAATDGTNVGAASPAIPVLLAGAPLIEVLYDSRTVTLTVCPPGDDTGIQHIPTLYSDGAGQNFPAFTGLSGEVALPGAAATSSYEVQITDTRTVPVQTPYGCSTYAPPGVLVGLVTQPASILGARYVEGGTYDIDAQGPTSVGPTVTGHRLRIAPRDVKDRLEVDCPLGEGRICEVAPVVEPGLDPGIEPRVEPGLAHTVVQAAGIAISGGATVRGPFSGNYYLLDEAPAGIRLALTTAGPLRAAWTAVTPLPAPLTITYQATLLIDGIAVERVATSTPGQLTAEFKTALGAGVIPTTTVLAVSSANSQGPPSAAARGPLRAVSTAIAYDSLGRLRSLPIAGWGTWSYTYDNAGNVLTASVAPAQPR
jgi:hypothetical protein